MEEREQRTQDEIEDLLSADELGGVDPVSKGGLNSDTSMERSTGAPWGGAETLGGGTTGGGNTGEVGGRTEYTDRSNPFSEAGEFDRDDDLERTDGPGRNQGSGLPPTEEDVTSGSMGVTGPLEGQWDRLEEDSDLSYASNHDDIGGMRAENPAGIGGEKGDTEKLDKEK